MTENDRRRFLKAAGATLAGALVGVSGCGKDENITREEINRRFEDFPRREKTMTSPRVKDFAAPMENPTREALVERLQTLAESETPTHLMEGACCYDPCVVKIVKKPCPACGRTMAVGEKDELLRGYNVPLKRLRDQGLDAKLILPEHCPTCGFGLMDCGINWSEVQTEQRKEREKMWVELREKMHEKRLRENLSDKEFKAEFQVESDKLNEKLDKLNEKSKLEIESRRFQLEITYPDHPIPVRAVLVHYGDLQTMLFFLLGKDRCVWENDGETAMKDRIDRLRELFGVAKQE